MLVCQGMEQYQDVSKAGVVQIKWR